MGRGAISSITTSRALTRHSAWTAPWCSPSASDGLLNGRDDHLLLRLTERRRRDVDRLFEKRTIERIGLVEDRQRSNAASGEHALNGILAALDEAFDDDLLPTGMSKGPNRGPGEQRADAVYRRGALLPDRRRE